MKFNECGRATTANCHFAVAALRATWAFVGLLFSTTILSVVHLPKALADNCDPIFGGQCTVYGDPEGGLNWNLTHGSNDSNTPVPSYDFGPAGGAYGPNTGSGSPTECGGPGSYWLGRACVVPAPAGAVVLNPDPDAGQQGANAACGEATDNPVIIENGKKILIEDDFSPAGQAEAPLKRYYLHESRQGVFGDRWSSSFDYQLGLSGYCKQAPGTTNTCPARTSSTDPVVVYRPDGARYTYKWNAHRLQFVSHKPDSIAYIIKAPNNSDWEFHTEDETVETYNSQGHILKIVDKIGLNTVFEYEANLAYSLKKVTPPSGRATTFTWQDGRVRTAADSRGLVYTYGYDTNKRLSTVTTPNNDVRQYTYGTSGGALGRLTGVSLNNILYKQIEYYSDGRVYRSGLANGVERSTFTYGADYTDVTNAAGAKTRYTYETANGKKRLKSVTRSGVQNCPTAAAYIEYDSINGYPDYETDWEGNKTDYSYNEKGQLRKKTTGINPAKPGNQRITVFEWDPNINRQTAVKVYGASLSEPVNETQMVYFPSNDLNKNLLQSVSVINRTPRGVPGQTQTTTYTYERYSNGFIKKQTVDGPIAGTGDKRTYNFDATGSLTSIVNGLNQTRTFGGYDGAGYPAKMTDENGLVTDLTYYFDGKIQTVRQTVNGSARLTKYDYDALGNLRKVTYPDNSYDYKVYDAAGRLVRAHKGGNDSLQYTYDALSNVTEEKAVRLQEYRQTNTKCTSQYTKAAFDPTLDPAYQEVALQDNLRALPTVMTAQDEVLSYVPPPSNPDMSYPEDTTVVQETLLLPITNSVVIGDPGTDDLRASQQCSNQEPQYQNVTYYVHKWIRDSIGRPLKEYGGNGQVSEYQYDQNGNVKTIKDAQGKFTSFTYTGHDEVSTVTNALGELTTYVYDAMGHIEYVTDNRGVTTHYIYDGLGNLVERDSPDSGRTTFVYNAGGQLSSMTRADNAVISYTYETLGRVKTTTVGGKTITYNYDTCTAGKGRLCSVSDASGSLSYVYFPNGTIKQQIQVSNGVSFITAFTYDAMDRLKSITYPGNNQAQYDYNSFGQVSAVKAVMGSLTKTVAGNIAYYPFGPASSWEFGNSLARASWRDQSYRTTKHYSVNVQDLSYTNNTRDEITKITNGLNSSLTQSFEYDAVSQLKTVVGGQSLSIAYAGVGNRQTINDGIVDTYNLDPYSNRISTITGKRSGSYAYDDLGNVTYKSYNGSSVSMTYDSFNRMNSLSGPQGTFNYVSNGFNQRVRKYDSSGSTYYVYGQDGELLGETAKGGSTLNTQVIWLEGAPIGVIRNGTLYYISNDQLGRPEAITNVSREIVWQASNFAFNRSVTKNTIGGFNLGFPGQYYDSESGLYYNWNRYYDPSMGRYLQSDLIGLEGGLNTYGYAFNQPTRYFDPSGLDTIFAHNGSMTYYNSDGQAVGTYRYTTGRPGVTDTRIVGQGPIPLGAYTADPSQISEGGFFRNLLGDWGQFRVPLNPSSGTQTFGRNGFFLHGGKKPGSAGCIDVGGNDADLFKHLRNAPGLVPIIVY